MVARSDFDEYPIDDITTPADGKTALANRWWIVNPATDSVLVYRPRGYRSVGAPQCNRDRRVPDRMLQTEAYAGCEVRHLPAVFWPPVPWWDLPQPSRSAR